MMLSYPYILFIDTETSGKPHDWEAPPSDGSKWPHIVQIAWRVHDGHGKLIHERNFYIRASDYSIRPGSEKVHGISEALANELGVARKEALKALYRDLKRYKPLIVGHFVTLDLHMVQAGFSRAGIKNIIGDFDAFCTMRATSDYIHLSNRNYPKLGELYEMLFKHKMENEHNAAGDAKAVSECFFELVRKGEVDNDLIRRQSRDLHAVKAGRKRTGCGLPVLSIFILIMLLSWTL